MIEAEIYKALGDSTRLEIVKRLAKGSPHTIGEISRNLGISRQGARKQLQVLVAANVVSLLPVGRETRVVLETSTLQIARRFIFRMENQWDERLEALKQFSEDNPGN